MTKPILTHEKLIQAAKTFCAREYLYLELNGVTDGKAVGTFVKQKFQELIQE